MRRLVIVSNRVAVPGEGAAKAGGLAVALQDALEETGGIWFGWSGQVASRTSEVPMLTTVDKVTYATLDLGRKDYQEYYKGYANRALWPLFHYRVGLTDYSRENFDGYMRVNAMFAEKLAPLLDAEDEIWVHDYHLIPLGAELRVRAMRQRMGFFLHTPFPAMELLLTLPNHEQLVRWLCAYDVVGFQTVNDLRAFHDYIRIEAGGEILDDGRIKVFEQTFLTKVFPIGIEVDEMVRASQMAMQNPEMRRIMEGLEQNQLLIGVDRLDYSKGIPERFAAFERFLEKYARHRRHVTLMQIAPPSRSDVPEYMQIRQTLETMAGHINGRFGDPDWTPITYLNKIYPREILAGYFRLSKVGIVTPLRDGMNLVAKEYVACQNPHEPGVLILSRFAGAARELDAALLVNPYDTEAVSDAMARALAMPLEERHERWNDMMEKVRTNSLHAWRDSFLKDLRRAPFHDA